MITHHHCRFIQSSSKLRTIASQQVLKLVILLLTCANASSQQVGDVLPDIRETTWEHKFDRATVETSLKTGKAVTKSEKVSLFLWSTGYALVEPEVAYMYHAPTRRRIDVIRSEKQYIDLPEHAFVWFVANEQMHRKAMCGAFASGTGKTAIIGELGPCSQFELETLLRVRVPGLFSESHPKIETEQVGDLWRFKRAGKPYVAVKSSAHELPTTCRNSYRQFLAQRCNIHPDIRRSLMELGRLPAKLNYLFREGNLETEVRYTLSSTLASERSNPFDLADGCRPRSDLNNPLSQILRRLQFSTIPTSAQLRKETEIDISGALHDGQTTEALLIAQRYFLITDDELAYRDFVRQCGDIDNTEMSALLHGTLDAQNLRQLRKTLTSQASKRAYLLDYFIADMAMAEHQDDVPVIDLLQGVLHEDPLILGAYVDLARVFLADFDIENAWQCIEAAKQIAPRHRDLKSIIAMEKRLERDFPDFF